MKKTLITVIALALLVGLATPSFAVLNKSSGIMRARLVSSDAAKREVVVNDGTTNMTFSVPGGFDAAMQAGQDVVVLYTKGTTVAKRVMPAVNRRKSSMINKKY